MPAARPELQSSSPAPTLDHPSPSGAKAKRGTVATSMRASADFLYRELLRRALVEVSDVCVSFVDVGPDGSELTACGLTLSHLTTEVPPIEHFARCGGGAVSQRPAQQPELSFVPCSSSLHSGAPNPTAIVRYAKVVVERVYWIPHHPFATDVLPRFDASSPPSAFPSAHGSPAYNTVAERTVVAPLELQLCLRSSVGSDGLPRIGLHCHLLRLEARLSLLQLADMARVGQVAALWGKHARYAHLRPRGYSLLRQKGPRESDGDSQSGACAAWCLQPACRRLASTLMPPLVQVQRLACPVHHRPRMQASPRAWLAAMRLTMRLPRSLTAPMCRSPRCPKPALRVTCRARCRARTAASAVAVSRVRTIAQRGQTSGALRARRCCWTSLQRRYARLAQRVADADARSSRSTLPRTRCCSFCGCS